MRTCIIILLLSVSFLTRETLAQVATTSDNGIPVNMGGGNIPDLEEKVYYTVLPEKPRVGDLVDITAQMYGTPVKDAVFTWTVNGVLYKKAQGLSKVSVYIEKNTKVSLNILTVQGTTIYKEWTFNPQNVIIFWEANTYTRPFYKGKPLYTSESTLTLQGINLDVKNPLTNTYANYVWKIDGTVQGSDSGVSRRTYSYKGGILQLEPLFELAYTSITNYQNKTQTDTSNSRAILRVQTQVADILTYEKKPLLGVLFNRKIQDIFNLKDKEASFVTYPMYFSVQSTSALQYVWSINNNVVKTDQNNITFKKLQDNQKSQLSIGITNPKSLLQSQDIKHIIDTTAPEGTVVGGFGN